MSIVSEIKCDAKGCTRTVGADSVNAEHWRHVRVSAGRGLWDGWQATLHFCPACWLKIRQTDDCWGEAVEEAQQERIEERDADAE